MGSIGLPELLIVLVVLLVVLGPKRLPRTARGLGSGMRNFKRGLTGSDDEPTRPPLSPGEPETVDGEVVRDSRSN